MNIKLLTVSHNYSDFLAWTLPINKGCFSETLVVTTDRDRKTQDICRRNSVKCITTGQPEFNKFELLNAGLQSLKRFQPGDWVLYMDADVFIVPESISSIQGLDLNPRCLYGADRIMLTDFSGFADIISGPGVIHEGWLQRLDNFVVGARIIRNYGSGGWIPLGFFNLWNPYHSGVESYPTDTELGADRGDVVFANRWHRRHRVLLPEVVCVHLDSMHSHMGQNWGGRTTPEFKYS